MLYFGNTVAVPAYMTLLRMVKGLESRSRMRNGRSGSAVPLEPTPPSCSYSHRRHSWGSSDHRLIVKRVRRQLQGIYIDPSSHSNNSLLNCSLRESKASAVSHHVHQTCSLVPRGAVPKNLTSTRTRIRTVNDIPPKHDMPHVLIDPPNHIVFEGGLLKIS